MMQHDPQDQSTPTEKLELEYRECNAAYHGRDILVQDQFYKMVQTLYIFVTALLAFRLFISATSLITPLLRGIFLAWMGFTGLLALVAIMADLQSNASCKTAIRNRARCIEGLLFLDNESGLWRAIDRRGKFLEERAIKRFTKPKPKPRDRQHEPDAGFFVIAARLLIILWVIIVFSVVAF